MTEAQRELLEWCESLGRDMTVEFRPMLFPEDEPSIYIYFDKDVSFERKPTGRFLAFTYDFTGALEMSKWNSPADFVECRSEYEWDSLSVAFGDG